MKPSSIIKALLACAILSLPILAGTMQVEKLNRGLIAVRVGSGYYLSWRLLADEPYTTGFNVYRGTTRLNSSPITGATVYTDAGGAVGSVYTVRAVVNGTEQAASEQALIIANTDGANAGYLQIPLQRPAAGQHGGTYSPNDGSVGDLNGDGVYEVIIKWYPSNAQDNANSGITDNVFLDAYTLTGTRLWRIDLGQNIRAGAHYTQFMVYDFDGCGKAEVMVKTAPGTRDGTGAYIKLGPAANAEHTRAYRNSSGYVLEGPEYLTVFDGATGRELATADYWPARGTVSSWGDNYGNRVDRFNAVVAYVDGTRPTAVFQRGYYTRMTFAAWDWRNGQLTRRWTFDSGASGNSAYAGQGNHQLSVADVDNSGRHSILTGAAVIKYDGTGLWRSGLGHGDALHVAHMIKGNPIPQVFTPQESGNVGVSLRNANNGSVVFSVDNSADVGRGCAADLDAARPGFKFWAASGIGLLDVTGANVGSRPGPINHLIWWDGALSRELLDGNTITKWSVVNNRGTALLTATGATSNNGTKSNPVLTADIFGDWREEVIFNYGNTALRLYTTTMTTTHRLVTMMHDPVYRVAVAWQNSSYNQPPHPGYYIASDMNFPPPALDVAVVGGAVTPPDPCVANPGSPACCTANPSHSSCQPPPPTWTLIGSGEYIDSLRLYDPPNAVGWSMQTDLRASVKAYGDRDHTIASVPARMQGIEWVAPSINTRTLTSPDTLVRFRMKKSGIVYVAHDDRVTPKPAWLAARGFSASGMTVTVRDVSTPASPVDRVFMVYSSQFSLSGTVALGRNSNDGTTSSMMYLIAAGPVGGSTPVIDRGAAPASYSMSVAKAGGALKVNYSVRDRGQVRIDLFDVKGGKVRTLVNSSRDPGVYQEQFAVNGLANGVYLVRLSVGGQILRERFVATR